MCVSWGYVEDGRQNIGSTQTQHESTKARKSEINLLILRGSVMRDSHGGDVALFGRTSFTTTRGSHASEPTEQRDNAIGFPRGPPVWLNSNMVPST